MFSLIFGMAFSSPLFAQIDQVSNPAINSPRPGDILQGIVAISGTSDVSGFISAEISFAYEDDPTGTWFLIATNSLPVSTNTLVTWDTTTITDGNYILRLRVNLNNGNFIDVFTSGLRVRNYSPIETQTPVQTIQITTPLATINQPLPIFPTPTALAPNPATIGQRDVTTSIVYGGFAAIMAFIIIGIYLWLRRK